MYAKLRMKKEWLSSVKSSDPNDMEAALEYIDVIQLGARNMHNFELLKVAGATNKPVLLKRGLSATIEEFIYAAEYIIAQGNDQIMLCERGIRTYERATRNTLDISAVPILKKETHLPVIVDVTHSTGRKTCCCLHRRQHWQLEPTQLWLKSIQTRQSHFPTPHNKWIFLSSMNTWTR